MVRILAALVVLFTPACAFAQSQEAEFLKLLNAYRAEHGLGPVAITPKLTKAALWMSTDMAEKDYINHTDSQGRDPFQRMSDLGYTFNTYKGENLAAGQKSAQEAFIGWKNSPGHNANMLKPEFKAIGIARVYNPNGQYKWYWTTNFGGYIDGAGAPPPGSDADDIRTTGAPSGSPIAELQRKVRENEPFSSFAIFAGAAWLTDGMLSGTRGWTGKILRNSLPIAAGIAAVQLARGDATPRDIAISAGAFGAAGLAVGLVADGLIYPALFAAGPPGWFAAGVYTVAKFGATWYLGSKLEGWLRGTLQKAQPTASAREGVTTKLAAIGEK
jgi:hypothetical protein